MGLVKRNHVWWMSFMYEGRQVRRSTGTTDKRVAEKILCKVKVQIAEGRFYETREEQERATREHQRALAAAEKRAGQKEEQLTRRLDRLGSQEEEIKRRLGDVGTREEALRAEESRYQELVEGVRRKLGGG